MLPSKDQLTICFAHVAYRLRERFLTLATGIESFQVRDGAALEQRIGEADVLLTRGPAQPSPAAREAAASGRIIVRSHFIAFRKASIGVPSPSRSGGRCIGL